MVGGNFNAGGEGAVRIDRKLYRGLASPRTQSTQFYKQAFFEQFLDDIGNGLRGKLGAAGNFGAPEMLTHPDDFEHNASVVSTIALRVGANGNTLTQIAFVAAIQDWLSSRPGIDSRWN